MPQIHNNNQTLQRAESVILKSGFCVNVVEGVYRCKNMCLCERVCIGKCANICVFLSHCFFFSCNKYAQHIYCLYLGKIDGIAGEQNIYHFCL